MALEEQPDSAQPTRSEPIPVPGTHGWFRRAVFGSAGIYTEVVIVALLVNVLALAVPVFAVIVFDQLVPFFAEDLLWRLGAGIVIVFGFDFALRMLRSHFVDAAGGAATSRIEGHVFQRILTAKMAARGDLGSGLASIANDLNKLKTLLTAAPVLALVDLPFIALFILASYMIGGSVAFIPLIAVPIVLFLSLLLQLPMRLTVARACDSARRRIRFASDVLPGLETIRIAVSESDAQRRWEALTAETQDAARRAQGFAAWIANFTAVATGFVTVGVIAYGVYLVDQGDLSVGGLVAVAMLAAAAMSPLERIASVLVDYHRARVAMDAIDELMRAPVERPQGVVFSGATQIGGTIAFQNVSFRYPGQAAPALDGVSFQLEAGKKLGLIGRIGSGKSTVVRLILGLYQPGSGLVAMDGSDISQIDPGVLRGGIGCVPQEVHLFEGSVRDNIALGAKSIDNELINRAARIAGVDEFADRHPDGYGMPVGMRGETLSAGERQAVAIARALFCDPPVLLLDEPTASLDNTSEGRFRARLANVMGDKTLLLVTNRASMLALVDRLIVIDGGKIIADGAKQDVLDGLQGGFIQGIQNVE